MLQMKILIIFIRNYKSYLTSNKYLPDINYNSFYNKTLKRE